MTGVTVNVAAAAEHASASASPTVEREVSPLRDLEGSDALLGLGDANESEEEEYESSYSRLASASAPGGRSASGARRRRGGYGHAPSALESLPERDGGNGSQALAESRDSFTVDEDVFELERAATSRPNIFMETQDDAGSDKGEDDGTSIHAAGGDGVDLDGASASAYDTAPEDEEGSDANSVRGDLPVPERPEEHPKSPRFDGQGEDEGVLDFNRSEASGHGFSDEDLPPRKDMSEEGEGAEAKAIEHTAAAGEEEPNMDDGKVVTEADSGNSTQEELEEARQREMELLGQGPEASGNALDTRTAHGDDPRLTEPTLEPESASNPADSQVISFVDSLFVEADKNTMTVGGINRVVAAHYGWEKVDKKRKAMIKRRLTNLIQGKAIPGGTDGEGSGAGAGAEKREKRKSRPKKSKAKKAKKAKNPERQKSQNEGSDEEDEGEAFDGDYESEPDVGNDSSSDYEKARPKVKSRGNGRAKTVTFDEENVSVSDDGSAGSEFKKRPKSKRAGRSRSKGKMAKHLRDRHAKTRRRQLEEARIRKEELGHLADEGDNHGRRRSEDEDEEAGRQPVSEEDRQRAIAIAERFETDTEELRIKRSGERVGLIGRMRARRLESLEAFDLEASNIEEDSEGEAKLVSESKSDPNGNSIDVKPHLDFAASNGAAGKDATNAGELIGNVVMTETIDAKDTPLLTSSNPVGALVGRKPANGSTVTVTLDEESKDDVSDEDLEIVTHNADLVKEAVVTRRPEKASAMDLLFNPKAQKRRVARKGSNGLVDRRMALRNVLNKGRMRKSNRWLAGELNCTEADHIRRCMDLEEKKRKEVLLLEKAVFHRSSVEIPSEHGDEDMKGVLGDGEHDAEEDDEEMAVARELNQLEEGATDGKEVGLNGQETEGSLGNAERCQGNNSISSSGREHGAVGSHGAAADEPENDGTLSELTPSASLNNGGLSNGGAVTSLGHATEPTEDALVGSDLGGDAFKVEDKAPAGPNASEDEAANEVEFPNQVPKLDVVVSNREAPSTQDHTYDANTSDEATSPSKENSAEAPTSNKVKNSGWKAMLQKEKESLSRQRKLHKKGAGLVEGEAEESEEEDTGIAGLEDFGFAFEKKKEGDNENDDEDGEVDEDDLGNVVDDVSDGEGDEEAGNLARKRLEQAEEKKRHKEIMRRMKEGYDGRRGGIAGGGARGMLRFDELVAADNREEGKRLGLLNDDEMNSEDEGEDEEKQKEKKMAGDDEVDEETALLDMMLKERALNREEDSIEENFTDEESEDEEDVTEENVGENEEDRQQERIAKHFAKRARRNRILEEFEGNGQFSRSRLIDEDASMQQDLRMMKNSLCRKRSIEGSNLDFQENNCPKKKNTDNKDPSATKAITSFLPQEGSLSVALMASRVSSIRKRKTTFLSDTKKAFSRSQSSSSSSRSVSLNHVVFMTGESQCASSQLEAGNSSLCFGDTKIRGHPLNGNGSAPKSIRHGNSLWSKVCSKNF